jgi:hypothetical protein
MLWDLDHMYLLESEFYVPNQSTPSSLAVSLISVLMLSSCGHIPGVENSQARGIFGRVHFLNMG